MDGDAARDRGFSAARRRQVLHDHPCRRRSARATSCAAAASMSTSASAQPRAASASAVARPSPLPAPVIMAALHQDRCNPTAMTAEAEGATWLRVRGGTAMLTKTQIEEYNEIGAIVVPDVLSADEVQRLRAGHRRVRRAGARRDGAQRDLRSRGQPHAGQPARPPHQGGAPASSGIRAPGAPSEDRRCPAGPVGARHPFRYRQAQHEVRRASARRSSGIRTGRSIRTPTTTSPRSA